MTSTNQWYLAVGGQPQGPMSFEAVVAKLKRGAATKDTLAFAQGVTQTWATLEEIPEFQGHLFTSLEFPTVPTGTAQTKGQADEIDFDIYGEDMQFVEIELDPGESAIAEAGAMMYMDSVIEMETIFGDGSAKSAEETSGWWGAIKSAGKRILTGESLFMTMFTHKGTSGKAKVAFAAPYPGKIAAVNLRDIGGTLICQKEAFLAGARGVAVGMHLQKKLGVGFFGGEGFIMQKLEGDGMVFCHAGGTMMTRQLEAGQTVKVDTGCVVAYTPSVNFDIQMVKGVKSMLFGGEGLFFATLTGPGRVWLQSIPFSRLATRIFAASRQQGGGKEEGSVLNTVFNLTGGKS
ncbi:MAG TPA: TIGR00266 family protein [Candidatus Ozemobacteraceae bacterium]|nr:TIGR00266 family protein [Candidatus Ozemobacteraceae bacterium]